MAVFLPDGKGFFRLWRKNPGGSKPPALPCFQSAISIYVNCNPL